jgi:Ca2+-binding RTX toxin-like protein
VSGGNGLDNIEASLGDDVLDGNAGRDFIGYFASPAAARVNLGAQTANGWGTDTARHFEGVVGSRFADLLVGSSGRDQLEGRRGNDRLLGVGGNDDLLPGPGLDKVNGGPGYDWADYWDASRGITASLVTRRATGNGADTFLGIEGLGGGDYRDLFTGNNGYNSLYGGNGNDRILGLGGVDYLWGDRGNDFLDGGLGKDRLDGGPGSDTCLHGETLRGCSP